MSDTNAVTEWLEAVRTARLTAGQPTVRVLGHKAGVSHTTVAEMFSGAAFPSWRTASSILAAMDCAPKRYQSRWEAAARQVAGDRMVAASIEAEILAGATPGEQVPSLLQELRSIRSLLERIVELLEK